MRSGDSKVKTFEVGDDSRFFKLMMASALEVGDEIGLIG
jgi:hypothetical protein